MDLYRNEYIIERLSGEWIFAIPAYFERLSLKRLDSREKVVPSLNFLVVHPVEEVETGKIKILI